MKIDRITFQKAFVTGPFLQEKLGMEILIDTANGETPEAAYTLAKQIVEQWHKDNNPVIPESSQLAPPVEIQVSKEPEEIRIGVLVEDIKSCDSLKVLDTYKFLVKGNPQLQHAFNQKENELISRDTK